MSLLDDARRLADIDPRNDQCDNNGGLIASVCIHCAAEDDVYPGLEPPHKPDCPWLSMPKIVAALEAAEQVMVDSECDPHQRVDGWRLSISLPLLRAALRGDA